MDAMASLQTASGRSSLSADTLCDQDLTAPSLKRNTLRKKSNKTDAQPSQRKKRNQSSKIDRPFYQILGEDLLKATRLHLEPITQPFPDIPPIPTEPPMISTPMSDQLSYFSTSESNLEFIQRFATTSSPSLLSRKSMESSFSGDTKVAHHEADPSLKYKAKGAVYSLKEFNTMAVTEDMILRYGRVAHMGVRDHSYKFWTNPARTAVVHFKVLNGVAVLGGDPLCAPERTNLTLHEFKRYCKKVGWKIAVIGGSNRMAELAKEKRWTCMRFGTERVLNPQTNEVLLSKSGKRIVTQCRQLLDPARGGISIRTYTPSHGRDAELETALHDLYNSWRNERNNSMETQAFVTVFDLFAMHNLMTFLYTTDREGQVNGFAALRKLGATSGFHIDPFIQSSSAPRGVSDLLIYASLAFLNAQGCSYLSLGYEPVTALNEIWGLPSIFHSTTKKVYRHVFGKIPVGGKEAFHARWKPDKTQEAPLYLVFVGKIPSPRYMLAMTHFANISFRQIFASDWQALVAKRERGENSSLADSDCSDGEALRRTTTQASRSRTATTETGSVAGQTAARV